MRIFLAGATGVIGTRLLPLMLDAGHLVAAMTRTPEKADALRAAGAAPIVCDLFDRAALTAAVDAFHPDVVVHQVTDLPDALEDVAAFLPANNRVRSEGTRNLLAAARVAHAPGFVAQSIAWRGGPVIDAHEQDVVAAGGTVLRYGRFYGAGTYYPGEPPPPPRIHVDDAARRTMPFLMGPPGIFTLAEDTTAS
jgi:nucleoside-diphosphate-sugar epimerase